MHCTCIFVGYVIVQNFRKSVFQAPESYVTFQMERGDAVLVSESRLQFALEPPLLWQGTLSVRCKAELKLIHDIRSLELVVGEGTSGAEFQRSELCFYVNNLDMCCWRIELLVYLKVYFNIGLF